MSSTTTPAPLFADLENFGAQVNTQLVALQSAVAALQTAVTAMEASVKTVSTAQAADQAAFAAAVKGLEGALAAINLGAVPAA